MSDFKLEHQVGETYDNRVSVEVRLREMPPSEDLAVLMEAVETLNTFGQKWVGFENKVTLVKETK